MTSIVPQCFLGNTGKIFNSVAALVYADRDSFELYDMREL